MSELQFKTSKDIEEMFPNTICSKCHNLMEIEEHRVKCGLGTDISKNFRWRKHRKECPYYESNDDAYNRFLRNMCL